MSDCDMPNNQPKLEFKLRVFGAEMNEIGIKPALWAITKSNLSEFTLQRTLEGQSPGEFKTSYNEADGRYGSVRFDKDDEADSYCD